MTQGTTTWQRRTFVSMALVATLAAAWITFEPAAHAQVPDDGVVRIDAVSPSEGPAGMPVYVAGRCLWSESQGIPMQWAGVRAYRVVSGGEEPRDQMALFDVDDSGLFSGYLVLLVDFPADDYMIELSCGIEDQFYPANDFAEIVVTGDAPTVPFEMTTASSFPGDEVTVTGTCPAGATTALATFSVVSGTYAGPISSTTPTGGGTFTLDLAVPAAPIGSVTLGVACTTNAGAEVLAGGGEAFSILEVTPPTTQPPVPGSTTTTLPGPDDDPDDPGPVVTPRFTG